MFMFCVNCCRQNLGSMFYFVLRGYKQSFKTKMLTIIPKESPAFAIEHAHYFTQEAIIINGT